VSAPVRALVSVLVAIALFAGLLLRLSRVPRPRFEAMRSFANGRVVLGRVFLARGRHPTSGTPLGWSVLCGGREVLSRIGDAPYRVVSSDRESVTLGDGASDRAAVVTIRDCRVAWIQAVTNLQPR
jgi:hypothetical protein